MIFTHRAVVRKAARTKVKVTRTYARTSALSKQMGQAVRADLLGGLKTFKRNIPADRLFNAWKTGDYTNVMRNIPWHELPEHLERARTSIGGAYEKSAEFNIKSLPANTKRSLRFDTKNPGIQKWLNSRTGDLIVNIQSDTQRVVQQAVKRSFDKALTPRQVANQIKNSIGLYPKQEQALANYRSNLESKQVALPPDRVDALVDAYADRLLDQRCMTIARTETRFAANQGQLTVWTEAKKQDLIGEKARKVWVVDGNPCEICEPMDGVAVPLDGSWTLNNGDVVDIPTDAHPNCFCGMELDFGESEGDEE